MRVRAEANLRAEVEFEVEAEDGIDDTRRERTMEDIREQKGLDDLAFVRQDAGESNMLGHGVLPYMYCTV